MMACQRYSLRIPRTIASYRRIHSNASTLPGDKLRILFLGRDEFSCLVLDELYKARDVWDELVVATTPDQRVGRRGNLQTTSPLKRMVEPLQDVRLELVPPSKAEFRRWKDRKLPSPFCGMTLDASTNSSPTSSHVLVTASFGRILTRKQLSHFLPTRRLNVHPSLLPQYRGPAPIQHALLNGEKETGVCIIEMLPGSLKKSEPQPDNPRIGIDAGDVWISKSLPQPENANFYQMRDTLGKEGGRLLVDLLRNVKNGSQRAPTPQHVDPRVFLRPAPMIRVEDAMFDPNKSTAEDVYRRWNAIAHQRPISAFMQTSSLNGSTFPKRTVQFDDLHILQDPEVGDMTSDLSTTPGAVICAGVRNTSDKALFIRCRDGGVIAVRKVKPEGKAAIGAQAFWNGVQGKNKDIKIVGNHAIAPTPSRTSTKSSSRFQEPL